MGRFCLAKYQEGKCEKQVKQVSSFKSNNDKQLKNWLIYPCLALGIILKQTIFMLVVFK